MGIAVGGGDGSVLGLGAIPGKTEQPKPVSGDCHMVDKKRLRKFSNENGDVFHGAAQ